VLELQVVQLLVLDGEGVDLGFYLIWITLRVGTTGGDHRRPLNVFEEHGDRCWNQILDREGSSDGEVSHRDKVCLLSVEVNETSNGVCVRVQHEENLIVIGCQQSAVRRCS